MAGVARSPCSNGGQWPPRRLRAGTGSPLGDRRRGREATPAATMEPTNLDWSPDALYRPKPVSSESVVEASYGRRLQVVLAGGGRQQRVRRDHGAWAAIWSAAPPVEAAPAVPLAASRTAWARRRAAGAVGDHQRHGRRRNRRRRQANVAIGAAWRPSRQAIGGGGRTARPPESTEAAASARACRARAVCRRPRPPQPLPGAGMLDTLSLLHTVTPWQTPRWPVAAAQPRTNRTSCAWRTSRSAPHARVCFGQC